MKEEEEEESLLAPGAKGKGERIDRRGSKTTSDAFPKSIERVGSALIGKVWERNEEIVRSLVNRRERSSRGGGRERDRDRTSWIVDIKERGKFI